MSLMTTCSACGVKQPLEAGFASDDAKQLASAVAVMDPVLGRAALAYLRLFKPPAMELRLTRAVKLLRQLTDLVKSGKVCPDERSALYRTATPAMWAAGIEQLMMTPPSGGPLSNHNYLRKVVYGLANTADAVAERVHEQALREPVRRPTTVSEPRPLDALQTHLDWLAHQLKLKALTPEQYEAEVAKARGLQGLQE